MDPNNIVTDEELREQLNYFGVSEKDYIIALKIREEEITRLENEKNEKKEEPRHFNNLEKKKAPIGGNKWLAYTSKNTNSGQIKKSVSQFLEENKLFAKIHNEKSNDLQGKTNSAYISGNNKIISPLVTQIKHVSKMIENTLNTIYTNEDFPIGSQAKTAISQEIPTVEGEFQNITQAEFFNNYYAGGVLMSMFSVCLWEFSFLIEKLAKEGDPLIKDFGEISGKIKDYIFEKWWSFGWKYDEVKDVNFYIKKHELGIIMDCFLEAIYTKQIHKIRKLAIEHYKKSTLNDDVPADFAFFTADSFFCRAAEESTMSGAGFSYETERLEFHQTIQEITQKKKQLVAEKLQHAAQQANAFQYLQMQQAQLQAIQQQQFGGGSGYWNIAAAYRPSDSNINISTGYQQGKTNIQISMVPDEQASLLGPNGFTSGVGPANLGLSLNLTL